MSMAIEPDCVTCKHYALKLKPGEKSAEVIRTVPNKCFCKLHGRYLPFYEAPLFFICKDWVDYASEERTKAVSLKKMGLSDDGSVLYSYRNIYELPVKVYKKFDDLPKVD